ncbi:MAG: NAD(P)H-hydrate dehydratase [Cytophagaceae bacterium]
MKILSARQTAELDAFTIRNESISSTDLMERASSAFAGWFKAHFGPLQKLFIFCGPGNNGGDGLAIARLLLQRQYEPRIFIIKSPAYSNDFQINKDRLGKSAAIKIIGSKSDIPSMSADDVIIDALFGSGLNRPPEGLFSDCILAINASGATIVSVDIASGLFADQVTKGNAIIQPAVTISFQLPKLAFFLPQNEKFCGEWKLVDIGLSKDFLQKTETPFFYTDEDTIKGWLRKRGKFTHKGTYGKSLIIGGSYGMIGAVILAAKACLRTGAGLCKTYIPECGYEIMQSSVPENIVLTDPSEDQITAIPELSGYTAIAIGPGISENEATRDALADLFARTKIPLVIDAGALNILAANPELLNKIPENSILTPHPKEFERLAGPSENNFDRLELVKTMAIRLKCCIVLKGAFSVICTPAGEFHFNSTGNPGMAKAGSGDVLTGIITSLLAQGYEPHKAAILGVFTHGFAGDAAAAKYSEYSINASDIIEGIHSFYQHKF